MTRVLALIYIDILKFHKKAVRIFRGKGAYQSSSLCPAAHLTFLVKLICGDNYFVPFGKPLEHSLKEYSTVSCGTDS